MNKKPLIPNQSVSGFTLIEMLVVIIMVGILAAIAGPSYLGLINRQRLTNAQEQVLTAMQSAQANARKERNPWETCFRDDSTKVLWASRAVPINNPTVSCSQVTNWQTLGGENSKTIAINTTNTNLNSSQTGYYRAQFEYNGSVNPSSLSRITLIVRNEPNGIKRCVFVSTILGALRRDKDVKCIISSIPDSNITDD